MIASQGQNKNVQRGVFRREVLPRPLLRGQSRKKRTPLGIADDLPRPQVAVEFRSGFKRAASQLAESVLGQKQIFPDPGRHQNLARKSRQPGVSERQDLVRSRGRRKFLWIEKGRGHSTSSRQAFALPHRCTPIERPKQHAPVPPLGPSVDFLYPCLPAFAPLSSEPARLKQLTIVGAVPNRPVHRPDASLIPCTNGHVG